MHCTSKCLNNAVRFSYMSEKNFGILQLNGSQLLYFTITYSFIVIKSIIFTLIESVFNPTEILRTLFEVMGALIYILPNRPAEKGAGGVDSPRPRS